MNRINLFYATNNKSKLHNMYYRLRDYPINIVCPEDINVHVDVDENGETAVENALIKASEYYKIVKMPTIAGDSGVRIDGIDKDDQPGLYVRRVNGKIMSDDEMIEYYANLADKAINECYLHYFTGIALITDKGTFTMELTETPLKLSPVPNLYRKHRGNPLDVVTVVEDGRFFNELSDEERTERDKIGEKEFTDFIIGNLL